MSNQEAIEALKRIRDEAIENFIGEWSDYEAFGIAIKALKGADGKRGRVMRIEVVQCGMCEHYDSEQYCEVWEQYITNDAFYCACGAKADRKTEPTSSKMEQVEDEPQTELVNDSPILAKDLVDDEFNPYDEECMRCKHLKLKCEFIPTYCKFESRDEPQTEREGE